MTANFPACWGVVIVAAGQSERYGQDDKLLLDLNGQPVITWSIRAMLSNTRIRQLVLVCSPSNLEILRHRVAAEHPHFPIDFSHGGDTRSESVRRGLDALRPDVTWVAVHDGARPALSCSLVSRVLDAAEQRGAAVPAVQPSSSIGVAGSGNDLLAGALDRSRLREIQTPQAAVRSNLIDALDRYPDETDESSALFRAGYDVALVDGEPSNIKITVPDDLSMVSALLLNRSDCQ